MKRLIPLLIVLMSSPLLAFDSTHPARQNASNAQQDHTIPVNDPFLDQKFACVIKAKFGELVANKKLNSIPLPNVLKQIKVTYETTLNTQDEMEWDLVLEMQRITRDAYRRDFNVQGAIDVFALSIYQSCVDDFKAEHTATTGIDPSFN